jgi:hypothetical protein
MMTSGILPVVETTARPTRTFYIWMSAACLILGLLGFSMTYWIPLVTGGFRAGPIVYIHAAAYYGWLVLLLTQSILVSRGEMRNHRVWGVAGVSLATAMVLIGVAVALHALEHRLSDGEGNRARAMAFIQVTLPIFFGGMVVAAILNVSRPNTHKRLIFVATITIIQAAIDRLLGMIVGPFAVLYAESQGLALPGPGEAPSPELVAIMAPIFGPLFIVGTALTDLLLIAGMIHDKRTLGRVHPAWWIGGGIMVAYQIVRTPLSETQVWYSVADWLLKAFG